MAQPVIRIQAGRIPASIRSGAKWRRRLQQRSERQRIAECTTVHSLVLRRLHDSRHIRLGRHDRGDYYWQDYSWARVFNDNPYDRLRGYTNVNLALILTSQEGWQVMGYVKNVFDATDITGAFLNSDDSGLTTNVFLTDPRLFGVRVTKNW